MLCSTLGPLLRGRCVQPGPPDLCHLGRHKHGCLILDLNPVLGVLKIEGLGEHIHIGLHNSAQNPFEITTEMILWLSSTLYISQIVQSEHAALGACQTKVIKVINNKSDMLGKSDAASHPKVDAEK